MGVEQRPSREQLLEQCEAELRYRNFLDGEFLKIVVRGQKVDDTFRRLREENDQRLNNLFAELLPYYGESTE